MTTRRMAGEGAAEACHAAARASAVRVHRYAAPSPPRGGSSGGSRPMNTELYIVQQVINAVALGSLYALVAIGLSMVFGILRMTNFAHGDMMMVGAFATLVLGLAGVPFVLAVAGGLVAGGLAGVIVERAAYRPVRGAPDVTLLLTSLGVTYILENLGILIFTSSPRNFPIPDWMNGAIQFADGQITFTEINVATVVLTAVSLGLLGWFVTRTDAGLGMRAAAEDLGAAQLVGLDVNRLIIVAFAIASSFAGLAGVLWAAQSGHRRAEHGVHAAAEGVRGRDHRRFRLDRRRAPRRLCPRRARGLHRRLPALGSLAVSRRDRLRPAHRVPALPAERAPQPDPGGQAVSRGRRLVAAAIGAGRHRRSRRWSCRNSSTTTSSAS